VAFQVFDIWDQGLLTNVIQRPPSGMAPGAAEDTTPVLGEQIAPLKPINSRNVRVRVNQLKPFGTGQLRAPDATPALFKPQVTWQETELELVLLDEMTRIPEEDWLKLNSADDNYRLSAGASLVDRGRVLKLRNERLTEKLRWAAFSGQIELDYPSGDKLFVDYGLPSGHKPTASVAWSDTTNSDPVSDVQAWAAVLAADCGFYGNKLHMNSKTYNYLILNQKIKALVNFYAAGANTIQRPRRDEILNLFTSFSTNVDIIIYDNGYRAENLSITAPQQTYGVGSITKYLPDGYVLMTPDYTLDGVPIADTPDGLVSVTTGYNSTAIKQGAQAEVMLDDLAKTYFLRYASARIPRLLIPEAFLYAKVY
jgi:hypothetical protein